MSDFLSYFETNWSAMTVSDWVGTILTVIIFILMFGMYFWVLRPKNKDKIEAHRDLPLREDDKNSERNDG
ncbi:cbb3-type cytochrome c oxidase subunit 3 [Methylophaga nitratireducenticrescens]|uniref:Cbb3-type cytochrome oxidase component FixQ n=1 Tax=Methylophaga nitratireducenticrescens TaxID=754476 RepID=I1XIF2_METNJ|nr:cbb3-type cytochrome c oxidase subunit 3 [Methylophaga nitratireducenticrescens]AFI84171.1 CcoQ/FixQ family Cbb3-type cytochrome c oxidase assembly chaperone [Methylophaga nitratireducenticrescens]AUZ84254.1 CcoQ/FixQ family Cbb3-type cytochrome c oxidase assembly chaperone [Methylophaga nitratireducenticrescens]